MSTAEKVDRIDYIDYARALGIILVIAGHLNSYNGFCKVWIYSFHMPLFFILSGMTLKSGSLTFSDFVYKRAKRLLVPYFIWAFIYSSLSINNILYICYGSYTSLSLANSLTSLWFFPVLFLSYIVSEFVLIEIRIHFKSSFSENIRLIIIGGTFLILGFALPYVKYGYPFGLNVAFSATSFMFIGKGLINLCQGIQLEKMQVLLFASFIMVIISLGAYFNIPDNGYILMANGKYNNPVLFIIVSLAGSGFIICISIIIERIHLYSLDRVLQYVGRNSLAIMVLHKPVILLVERLLNYVLIPQIILLSISCIIVLIICCGATWIINKVAPQIIGN